MSLHDAQLALFDFLLQRDIEVCQVDEQVSSDGGLLVFRQLDQKRRITESFANVIGDLRRDPDHTLLSIIRQRVFGIIAGYEDQNDHDTLRSDPVFKLIADRTPEQDDLASQPTISRIENAVTPADLLRLEDWFIQSFVDSFDQPPNRITLDIDTFADPTHGDQQLTFYNGFYGQYQYQVRVITCAENEQVVLPVLLHGTAHAALAAEDDLARVIETLRRRYPDVEVHVRADSAFAKPSLYRTLESLPAVSYSIGYSMDPSMRQFSEELMAQTHAQHERSGQPQRNYMHLRHQARRWAHARELVIKCEASDQGTNRRAVITNRPGAAQYPDGVYQEYSDRGESENRNKELSVDLSTDRLSDHRYMANLFRVMLHSVACNLLSELRRVIADPLPDPGPDTDGVPLQASSAYRKRTHRNRNRRHDRLGRGQAMTWRMLVIKVAARVITRTRCVRLLIPSSWPHADYLRRVSESLTAYQPSG